MLTPKDHLVGTLCYVCKEHTHQEFEILLIRTVRDPSNIIVCTSKQNHVEYQQDGESNAD